MMRTTLGAMALVLGLVESACVLPPGDVGDLPPGSSGGSGNSDDFGDGSSDGAPGSTGVLTADAGESGESADTGEPPPSACGPGGPPCHLDQDGDCVALDEDLDPSVYNPAQSDLDGDGFVDEIDLCPTLFAANNTADSDDDGIGNGCDPCRRAAADYNLDQAAPMGYMRVRNVASVADADGDGIGDVCDNCVQVANCEGYGPMAPWQPGDPIADGDPGLCQSDGDADMVGDACAGMQSATAAGPVGLGPDDDFDQDGLRNVVDACPRQPVADAIACTGDDQCPPNRACEAGLCDHADLDRDGVGDACDTCPSVENPMQVADGAMQDGDDLDGDFVGNACEVGVGCELRHSPRRTGFYPVAVDGQCCTVAYRGDGTIFDPDGLPVTLDCPAGDEGVTCRRVPLTALAMPGLVALPGGCEQALAEAGLTVESHQPLQPGDVGGVEALWAFSCQLPPLDQDFDGLGDECDLCTFAFDPENLPYIDQGGMMWPDDGKYCNGEYSVDHCA